MEPLSVLAHSLECNSLMLGVLSPRCQLTHWMMMTSRSLMENFPLVKMGIQGTVRRSYRCPAAKGADIAGSCSKQNQRTNGSQDCTSTPPYYTLLLADADQAAFTFVEPAKEITKVRDPELLFLHEKDSGSESYGQTFTWLPPWTVSKVATAPCWAGQMHLQGRALQRSEDNRDVLTGEAQCKQCPHLRPYLDDP